MQHIQSNIRISSNSVDVKADTLNILLVKLIKWLICCKIINVLQAVKGG